MFPTYLKKKYRIIFHSCKAWYYRVVATKFELSRSGQLSKLGVQTSSKKDIHTEVSECSEKGFCM